MGIEWLFAAGKRLENLFVERTRRMNAKSDHVGGLLGISGLLCLALAVFSPALSEAGDKDQAAEAAKAAAEARGAKIKLNTPVAAPKIIALRFRHDMCPFCKNFDPNFPKLIRQSSDESVLFVTLDLTNETTQKQAALLVAALGLEHLWPGDMSKIGTIMFVDGKTKQIKSSVYQVDMTTVRAALREAVDS